MQPTRKQIVRSRLPVLDVGTDSRLLFVLLTQWTHLKPSLKLICLLRPTQCSWQLVACKASL